MDAIDWRDYIVSDPAVLGGKPTLRGDSTVRGVCARSSGGRMEPGIASGKLSEPDRGANTGRAGIRGRDFPGRAILNSAVHRGGGVNER